MTTPDADPFLSATPEDVEDDLRRAFMTARTTTGISRKPGPCVTQFPAAAAESAMSRARPVLEAKDAEIARLREQVESVRADERQRCVTWLREKAKEMSYPPDAYFIEWLAEMFEQDIGVSAPAVDTGDGRA